MPENIKLQKNIVEVVQAWGAEHGARRSDQMTKDFFTPCTMLLALCMIVITGVHQAIENLKTAGS